MTPRKHGLMIGAAIAILLLAPSLPAEEGDGQLRGEVEVLYRNVGQEGSTQKYNEDFDGLESGGRLGNLSLAWESAGDEWLDYASLDVYGLGGDPYEHTGFRLGRKDVFDIRFNNREQRYLYDLFEVTPDEDANTFNTNRRMTDLRATFYPADNVQVFAEYKETARTGDSLFVKDLNRELFRFEAPIDQSVRRYTAGASFRAGPVDLSIRQSLRRLRTDFVNETEGNLGLELDDVASSLLFYDWHQRESSSADLTTLDLRAPLGSRVRFDLRVHGTLIGDEEFTSDVSVMQAGTDFNGNPIGGSCSLSGGSCATDGDCDPLGFPGDVCVLATGFSEQAIDVDTLLVDADLSIAIAAPVDLHLQYRTFDRDLESDGMADLSASGTPVDIVTRQDYSIDTATVLLAARPTRKLSLRAGYRMIDRTLDRVLLEDGVDVGGVRNTDFESDGDETLVFGLSWRPVDWFRLGVDAEDGDIDQPFTAIAPQERERQRLRAVFTPDESMQIALTFLSFENTSLASDFRGVFPAFEAGSEGTSWAVAFTHRASEKLDYTFRYSEQELDTSSAIVFDTAGFAGTEMGDTVFDNTNSQILARIAYRPAQAWRIWLRGSMTESDGNNLFVGDVSGLVNDQVIDQEFLDAELAVRYTLPDGIFVGAGLRVFDYDDASDVLDYEGDIVTLSAGMTF